MKKSLTLYFPGISMPSRLMYGTTWLAGPWYMFSPRHIKIKLSSMLNSLELGWWIVKMTVLPCFPIFVNMLRIIVAVKLSSPDVGSSRINTAGLAIISMPTQVLFL